MKDDTSLARTAKKRRKTNGNSSPSNEQPLDPKHTLFTQWSRDRGIKINSVKPAALPGRGIGLMTTARIRKGEQILFVPEKAMFKPNVTSIGKEGFEKLKVQGSPQAQLAICLAAELAKAGSTFHVWRETWPTPKDFHETLPLNWTRDMQEQLPESVLRPLHRQQEDYAKDLACFESLAKGSGVKKEDFHYCWEIVNSRSFHFKPAGVKPGYMVLCPFIDYMNHGPNGTGVIVRQTPKGYEVCADRDYEPNTEILATYGAHSNDKLLVHYGFINVSAPREPTDDDIRLDHIILPALSSATREALLDVGFLGGYALLPATNELCFKTQVAARAVLLTANEWEYFIGCGEDLRGDQSDKVLDWIRPKLAAFHADAKTRLSSLSSEEARAKVGNAESIRLLKTRWKQIAGALEAFVPDLRIGKP